MARRIEVRDLAVTLLEGQEKNIDALYKPRRSLNSAALHVCTLNQIGKQVPLAKTFKTFRVDVCHVSEAHVQDPTCMITLHSLDTTSFSDFNLCISIDPALSARGQSVFRIHPSMWPERALLDWIIVNNPLMSSSVGWVLCASTPFDWSALFATHICLCLLITALPRRKRNSTGSYLS